MTATSNYRQREPMRTQPSPHYLSSNDFSLTDEKIRARQQAAQVNLVVTPLDQNVWHFEHPWSTSLCSCCDDIKQCCYGFWCPWCFQCQLFKRSGENLCACWCPGSLFALRSKIRTAFRIKGDFCNDCCVTSCCPCCAAIQLMRELHYQGL